MDNRHQNYIEVNAAAANPHARLHATSCLSKCFFGVLLTGQAGISYFYPSAGLLVPLLFIPSFVLWVVWRKYFSDNIDFDMLVRLYGAGFMGSIVVVFVELLLIVVFSLIFFYEPIKRVYTEQLTFAEIQINHNVGFWLFLLILSYVVAGWTVEGLKYKCTSALKAERPRADRASAFIVAGVASALGFSTIENIGYVMYTWAESDYWVDWAIQIACRTLLASPLHCTTGVVIAIGVAKRDAYMDPSLQWYHILAMPVFFHGSFYLAQLTYMVISDGTSPLLDLMSQIVISIVTLAIASYYAYRKYISLAIHEHLSSFLSDATPIEIPMEDLDDVTTINPIR